MKKPDITVTEKTLETRSERPATETSRLKVSAMRAAVEASSGQKVDDSAERPERVEESPQPEAKVEQHHTEQDQELAAMLEERDSRLNKRKGRVRLLANVALLALFVTPVTVVAVNPELRAKFEKFATNLGEGVDDVKSMANAKDSFDEALKGVAARGEHVDEATKMLGFDPNSVSEDDDLQMTAEMTKFMGEEADGFAIRHGKLKSMGTVATALTGMEETTLEDIRAAESEQQ